LKLSFVFMTLFNLKVMKTNSLTLLIIRDDTNDSKPVILCMIESVPTTLDVWTECDKGFTRNVRSNRTDLITL
jgi:hypothetical protein